MQWSYMCTWGNTCCPMTMQLSQIFNNSNTANMNTSAMHVYSILNVYNNINCNSNTNCNIPY